MTTMTCRRTFKRLQKVWWSDEKTIKQKNTTVTKLHFSFELYLVDLVIKFSKKLSIYYEISQAQMKRQKFFFNFKIELNWVHDWTSTASTVSWRVGIWELVSFCFRTVFVFGQFLFSHSFCVRTILRFQNTFLDNFHA